MTNYLRPAVKSSVVIVLFVISILNISAKKSTKDKISVAYIKSKITVNQSTRDSIKLYFGKPSQKRFEEHVDYLFNETEDGHPISLSINFYDFKVTGESKVRSFMVGTPGKGVLFQAGMQ